MTKEPGVQITAGWCFPVEHFARASYSPSSTDVVWFGMVRAAAILI